jgi:phage terminase small subunit
MCLKPKETVMAQRKSAKTPRQASNESKFKREEKEKRFVAEYIIDFNGTRAATAAGWAKHSAGVTASKMLKNPKIQEAIAEAAKKALDRVEATQERTLREVARIAFSDLRKVLTPDGRILDPEDWDDDIGPAVVALDTTTRREVGKDEEDPDFEITNRKIKVADKNAALKHLMMYHGMFKEDNDQKGHALAAFFEGINASRNNRIAPE